MQKPSTLFFKLLLAMMAVSLCLIAMPVPVYADTESLHADGADLTNNAWTGVTQANLASNDGDTSYANSSTKGQYMYATVADSAVGSGTINSVTVKGYFKTGDEGQTITLGMWDGTTLVEGDAVDPGQVDYTIVSYSRTTNPAGGTWTWADVNSLEITAKSNKAGAPPGDWRCTEFWIEVDYTSAPPAFDFSVSASPDTLSVQQAGSVSTTVSVALTSGVAETVSLSGTWIGTAPGGVTPSFSPPSGTPNFGSILTFETTAAASVGTFTYRVVGTGGDQTHTADVSLEITELLLPVAPSLVSPENGGAIDTLTPTFDWSDAVGATSYTLEVATDNNFSNIVCTKTAIDSNVTLSETEKLSYGTHYYWRVRGTNAAGSGDWSLTWGFTAKLTAPKVTTFEIAAGAAYTNSTSVQLTITAQNAVEMSFSSDGVVWSGWESYRTSKSYTLSGPEGSKNIYIRVRDSVGDISQTSMDSITLDQTLPSTTHSLSGDLGVEGYKGSVVVTLASTDAYGVESTKYRIDNDEWRTGRTFVVSGDGKHMIEYYSTDMAGNGEEIKSLQVTVYTPTMFPPILIKYWWAFLGTIVAVGVASVFVTRKVRLSGRLKRIGKEKREIIKLMKEAETKYYKEGSITRDAFDELMRGHETRAAELEKEERVLKAKVKKVKGKQVGKKRKRRR